ncbi:MAG: hypothetical protein AAGF47_00215 [Planctomycetota bacterium]
MAASRTALAAAVLIVLLGCSGCRSAGGSGAEANGPAVELPGYDALYAKANRRIGTLDRYWARAIVALRYVDAEGERRRDQGEGHLQFIRPGSVALFVGKLGEPGLILGSDGTRFWWIELIEARRALVGEAGSAAAASVDVLGVPILPRDLLLGLDAVPWPEPGSVGLPRVVGVSWTRLDGLDTSRTAAVGFEDADRRWRVHVDVFTGDPMAVEILTAAGEPVCVARLGDHGRVLNRLGAAVEPRMAGSAIIEVPAAEATIELTLRDAELSPRRPRPVVFDLDQLLERFRVEDVRVIREGAGGPAS